MKKIFFSVLAIAAIAACSKSEVQYTDQQLEIGFAPVSKISTKAAVADTDYPINLDMFVFANAGIADDEISTYSEVYFRNARFTNKDGGVFGGTPNSYYWPNVKGLIFSGVSESGNVNKSIVVTPAVGETPAVEIPASVPSYAYFAGDGTNPAEWQIGLAGYTPYVGTSTQGDNDLMWFPTTTSFGKEDVMGDGNDGDIDVEMKHACAWVTININGDAVTGVPGDDAWKVTEVKFNNLVQIGDVKLGGNAVWTISDPTSPADNEKTPLPVYASDGNSLTALVTTDGEKTGYTDYTKLQMTDLVVIPQTTKTLSVTYKFVSQKAADGAGHDIVISETKEIPLSYTSGNTWDAGKHYIYNIIIGTQEILVEPSVADWTPDDIVEDKEF